MSVEKSRLYNKIYGSLIAGIIGDAMGAPLEGKRYKQIEEKYGEVNDFEGAGTDDSAIKQILCEAIIANDGEVTADEFAEFFLKNKSKYYNLFYIPVKNMFHKIESGLTLPVYAGLGNMHSSSSAMSISPMGLINACDPRQAAIETYDVAGLLHAGDSTFCRDGACAMAASVAEAVKMDSTVESVIGAATFYLHKKSSAEMIQSIENALAMAKSTGNYKGFREKYYQENLRDIISDSRETVSCVLALFYLADGDPIKAIIYGANFGRDADTIGTMVGAITGAFKGSSGLKKEWVEKIEEKMPEQRELAKKITEIAMIKKEKLKESINAFEKLF